MKGAAAGKGAKLPTVYAVSDGRGETCQQVVKAAVVQFEGLPVRLVRRGQVRTARRVETVMREAAEARAIVFYTLVGDETREALAAQAKRLAVPTVDVLGPAFSALHDLLKRAPRSKPGLLYRSDRERFDRQVAIDYTLAHDDGQRLRDLDQADVVLVGVSRSSKTSTCFYLAYEGVKAANVPLVPDVPLPQELADLDPEKVIGLRMNVIRLMTVREARAQAVNHPTAMQEYLDQRSLTREVIRANRLMDERGWRSLDASYMAVEEVAREVMAMRGLRGSKG